MAPDLLHPRPRPPTMLVSFQASQLGVAGPAERLDLGRHTVRSEASSAHAMAPKSASHQRFMALSDEQVLQLRDELKRVAPVVLEHIALTVLAHRPSCRVNTARDAHAVQEVLQHLAIVLADAEAKSVRGISPSPTGVGLMRDMDAGFAVSKPSSPRQRKRRDIGTWSGRCERHVVAFGCVT